MRVLLISANREEINMATLPLGLALVAAAVSRAGFEVRMLDLRGEVVVSEIVTRAVLDFQPEVIGVSVRNIDDQEMTRPRFLLDQAKEVVDVCRSLSGAPVILGGAGFSIFPGPVLAYLKADLGIEGEGEWVFPELLLRLEKGRSLAGLPGLWLPKIGRAGERTYNRRLDQAPFGDLATWFKKEKPDPNLWAPFQTRRGCPLACLYCSTPGIEGRGIRKCTPRNAARNALALAEAGFQGLFIVDNTFNLPASFAKDFCRELISLGFKTPWRAILYAGRVDSELVELMARSGCRAVSLGFESGSAVMLEKLRKRFTLDEVARVRGLLAGAGLACTGFLLLGAPGETRETVYESLEFADRLGCEMLNLTVGLRIYPGAPLADLARRRGLIGPDDDLLHPRFYLEPGLEDWLPQTAAEWARERPTWLL
ncbi:MAG: radical SAM protein [Pseudomonadota bacterium]